MGRAETFAPPRFEVLTCEHFQTFTDLPIGDPAVNQLNDPDGNILEFGWVDPAAAAQGAEAVANQLA